MKDCQYCEGSGIRRPANLFDDYDTEFCDCFAGNPQKLLNKNEETVLRCPNCNQLDLVEQKIWSRKDGSVVYTGDWNCDSCGRNFEEVKGELVQESEREHFNRYTDQIKENEELLKAARGL